MQHWCNAEEESGGAREKKRYKTERMVALKR